MIKFCNKIIKNATKKVGAINSPPTLNFKFATLIDVFVNVNGV